MDFDDKYLKVVCFASSDTIKGLQWALDRTQDPDRKFRLFSSTLASLGTDKEPKEMDLAFAAIDLGQPIPLENLGKLQEVPGLMALEHPTPQQLLNVFELDEWRAVAWDGVQFEKIVHRLFELADFHKANIRKKHFIESCRAWIRRSDELPDFVEWVNPPENYLSPKLYALDTQYGILTIGSEGSGAQLKVPDQNSNRRELGEFRFINGQWAFKSFATDLKIEIRGQSEKLKPGDQLTIKEWVFSVRKSPRIDDFVRMARNTSVWGEVQPIDSKNSSEKTLAETIKEALHAGMRGELRLTSGLKHGSLFFEDAKIIHARTGPVAGRKAALRMLGWDRMTWKFIDDKMPVPDRRTMNVTYSEFSRMHQVWKTSWQTVVNLQPPVQLKLKAHPNSFMKKKVWTVQEANVFSALCEYSMVRDILNFCSLDDVTIVETLVTMRKQGLVDLIRE